MSLKRKIISESVNWATVLKMPFVDAIKKAAGQVYVVGGSVRDHYLGKDSKDVDLLVRNLPQDIIKTFGEFNKGLPKQIKELAIDGNELMALGFKGKDIGEKQKLIMSMIYHDKLKNNKETILQYLKEKSK